MGVVLVRNADGRGTTFAEPSALKGDWTLRLGAPLLSPHSQYLGYLGAIFIGVLKNSLPFAGSWAEQLLSALAWLQVSILAGYSWAATMRAMHKGLQRA